MHITDAINPTHYKMQKVETIALIRDAMTDEAYKGFLKGNIIKYITRYQYKNGIEDLRKAQWYLSKLVEIEEEEKEHEIN